MLSEIWVLGGVKSEYYEGLGGRLTASRIDGECELLVPIFRELLLHASFISSMTTWMDRI